MALTKECTLSSQVVIDHFVINSIIFNPAAQSAFADVSGYVSADAKAEGATPAWRGSFKWDTGGSPQLAAACLNLAEGKLASEIEAGKIK